VTEPPVAGDALKVPWTTRVLEASAAKLAAMREQNRNDTLARALGAADGKAEARVCSGWQNLTEDQWFEQALGRKGIREVSPVAAGLRNEYLSAQILYAPPGRPKQVTCQVSDFTGPDGATIPASACQARMVEYVQLEGT
jgi:hypothetical protein